MCRGARLSRAGASHGPGPPAFKALASAASGLKAGEWGALQEDTNNTANSFICNLRATWGSRDRRDLLM